MIANDTLRSDEVLQDVGHPRIDAQRLSTMRPAWEAGSRVEYRDNGVAVAWDGAHRFALITDPDDIEGLRWVVWRAGNVGQRASLVSRHDLEQWLIEHEQTGSAMDVTVIGQEPSDQAKDAGAEDLSLDEIGAQRSVVVRFVQSTLFDALRAGASDIHLEAEPLGLKVRLRVDGVLQAVGALAGVDLAEQVVSRIKVRSGLDIAERRVPQDGRLSVRFQGRQVDVRVSVMPSVHGEDVVLRILDRAHLAQRLEGLTLAKLGFDAAIVSSLRSICARPHGMVLVAGPTGSGKTTTLYAALAETAREHEKVVTIEDPVEYQLPGVLQIPVNERTGLTFARGLRSILRHDPDRILVGEIRDAETAEIAVQAALTGHLVYTTLHANHAFDVRGRLTQLGVDRAVLASALGGVLSQRLVRLVCPHCAEPATPVRIPMDGAVRDTVRAVGCERCHSTGYSGRRAVGELLVMDAELRRAFGGDTSDAALAAEAVERGWRSLRDQALDLVASGLTTIAEVDRVAQAV